MSGFLDKVTDHSEQARLRRQGDVAIWLAVREMLPLGKIDGDMKASASRIATHYAQGGPLDDLSRDTVFIKAGFRLGILQSAHIRGGVAETEDQL